MFAVIQTGGKQYKVAVGDMVKVEKLELEVGSKVEFDVLLTNTKQKRTIVVNKVTDNHLHKSKF